MLRFVKREQKFLARCFSALPIDDTLFGLSSDEKQLRQSFRSFFEFELDSHAFEIDKNDHFPQLREYIRNCGKMGILGLTVPEKFGGTDLGYFSIALAAEENARVNAGIAMTTGACSNLFINQIVRNGSEEQKETLLPDHVAGKLMGGLAMTELNAGSDVMSMKTNAVKKGDFYVINGNKFWITNGPVADHIVLYAKTNPSSNDGRSITAFIVDTKTEGFSAQEIPGKLGMRGSPTGDLTFENMKIHESMVLKGEGRGAAVLMSGLNIERILAAAIPVGIAQAAIDCAFKYAHEREQFNQRIGEFQLVQGKMADMYTSLSACRSYLYNVARHADKNEPTNHDCAGLVLYCAEKATQICLDAIQILGGNGYRKFFYIFVLHKEYFKSTIIQQEDICVTRNFGKSVLEQVKLEESLSAGISTRFSKKDKIQNEPQNVF